MHRGCGWEVGDVVEVIWVQCVGVIFFLRIRRPPRSTQSRSSAASDVYKRQVAKQGRCGAGGEEPDDGRPQAW